MMHVTNKVLLIYTGGTIGMGRNATSGALEPLDFKHLISNVPEFQYVDTEVVVYQFASPIDSSDMSSEFWGQLVRIITEYYDRVDGFVILHGTDTMAYTASALSFMLENLTKPVILTGSQLPIGLPRTDGKENLVTSIELAAARHPDGRAMVPEVCVYFSGRLLRGNRSTKCHADGFDAFESFNYPHLCDAGVKFDFHTHNILERDYSRTLVAHATMLPAVVVFSIFPGIQESVVRHMLAAPDLRGIVMRSYGSGNAPQSPWLLRQLEHATNQGVVVVNVSQCAAGMVDMSRYSTGYQLAQAGVVSGNDSTVEAAVTKLMFLAARTDNPDELRAGMSKSIVGEITLPQN